MDYSKLKPGLYLQQGEKIKALTADAHWPAHGQNTPLEKLTATVAWQYTAIDRRQEMINQIPYQWQVGDEDVDRGPYGINVKLFAPRIDKCLQLYAYAAILKQRVSGGQVVGLRWLDPTTIEPDYDTVTPDGFVYFWRTGSGPRRPIPAGDIIYIYLPGMREMQPASSAALASSLPAQILKGISETADTFFDNNGLPVMLVKIPDTTSSEDKDRIEDRFRRLFNRNRGTKEIRAAGISERVEVETLSLTPDDLSMPELTDTEIDQIMAVHGVRKSQVLGNAANRSVAITDQRAFVSMMGARLEFIAEFINNDPDIAATGYELVVKTEQHSSMKRDEVEASAAFVNYMYGMYPEAAGYLLGISTERFPEEMRARVFRDVSVSTARTTTAGEDVGVTEGADAEDVMDETKALATERHKDLARWKLKASKAVEFGRKLEFDFFSDHIEPATNAAIKAALIDCESVEEVKAVFDDVWKGYP